MERSLWNLYHSYGASTRWRLSASRGRRVRHGLDLERPYAVRRSVLLVDDDEPSVKLARVVLEDAGWRVYAAPNLERAERLLASAVPALVVTELLRPDPFGHLSKLRLAALDIPIVAVTARSGPGTEFRTLMAGCVGFIRKPIDITKFSNQLLAFLGGSDDQRPSCR